MPEPSNPPFTLLILIFPHFNLAATTAFIDPFRSANYLSGQTLFHREIASSDGGNVVASNAMEISTGALAAVEDAPNLVMVSASWAPESHNSPALHSALRAQAGSTLGALASETARYLFHQIVPRKNESAT